METKVNINTEKDVIHVFHVNALDPKAPLNIKIDGILDAPAQFLKNKKGGELFEPKNCHVLVDKVGGKIEFIMNDKSAYGDKVVGKLKPSSLLSRFVINSEKRWSSYELQKFLKTVKFTFTERAECDTMIDSLNNFTVNVNKKIENYNNNNGNTRQAFETVVEGVKMKETFNLNLPVFEGYEKKKFTVSVGIDANNAQIRFFLFSDDLYILENDEREKLLAGQIAIFEEFGCSVVHIS